MREKSVSLHFLLSNCVSVYLFQVFYLLFQRLVLLHQLVLRHDVHVQHLLDFAQLNFELTNHLELDLRMKKLKKIHFEYQK